MRFVAEPAAEQLMSGQFGRELLELVDSSAAIVIDFRGVKCVRARMISDLLVMHKAVLAHRGVLRMVRMHRDVFEMFELMGLDKCFDIKTVVR